MAGGRGSSRVSSRIHPDYNGPPITPEEAHWARSLRELPLTSQGVSGGAAWSNPIPRGHSLFIFVVGGTVLSGNIVAKRGSTASLTFQLNPQGWAYLRSADGFTAVSSSDTTVYSFLEVDLGSRESEIRVGGSSAAGGGVTDAGSSTLATSINTTSGAPLSTGLGFGPISPKTFAQLVAALMANQNLASEAAAFRWYRNLTGVPVANTSVGTDTVIGEPSYLDAGNSIIEQNGVCHARDYSPVSGAYYYLAYNSQGGATLTLFGASSSIQTMVWGYFV